MHVMSTQLIRFFLAVYLLCTTASLSSSQDYFAEAKSQLKTIEEIIKWREEQLSIIQDFKPRYDKKGVKHGPDAILKEYWFKDKDERKSRLELSQKALVNSKLGKFNQNWSFPTVGIPSKPGDLGHINVSCKVLDVWSNGRILVDIKWTNYSSPELEPGIPSKIDYATAIVENTPSNLQLHRLEFEIPPVQVLGDEVYQAQDGPRRVWKLKILDGNPQESFKSAVRALKLVERQNRPWKDSAGVIIGSSSLAAFDGKVVTLSNPDGSTLQQEIAKLSDDDKSFVIDALWFRSSAPSTVKLK